MDFLKVLIEFLIENSDATNNGVYMNGICNSMASSNLQENKPMSLFQCRIKLFNQWSKCWSTEFRTKLIEKINDLDPEFGLKLNQELEEMFKQDNAESRENFNGNGHVEELQLI
jgi:hypothetical protein